MSKSFAINPFFSIVMPVYDVAGYLRQAIDSVLSQTDVDWELVCVDDGSNDGSAEILDEYAALDKRVKVIHQPNCGVGAARNAGLRVSTGDWVCFLDGDDVWRDCFLSETRKAIVDNDGVDMVFHTMVFFDRTMPVWNINAEARRFDITKTLPASLIMSPFFVCVYNRRVLPSGLFKEYSVGEDRLFLNVCLAMANSAYHSGVCTYGYRKRIGSAMNSKISLKKLNHRIGHSLDWLKCIAESGKIAPPIVYRLIVNHLTECYIYDLKDLSVEDKCEALDLWYSCLQELRQYRIHFSLWSRFVVFVCSVVKLRIVSNLLCFVPMRVKLMGLHR